MAGLQTSGTGPDTRIGQSCTTDARGDCTFDDLPLGEYYVREVAVPEGYELPGDHGHGDHDGYGHSDGYGDSGTGCAAPDGGGDSGKEYGDK
ncbi:prealbumin-like fold domain-containing protein [Streptomyces sp. CSDS2]|uniref:prealbumin-like fold domain-containing protein n=1 Tax=Streptomyces sp. CSDS2 TaxID=3055051 RepID=UPI0025B20BDD|nr:prealbumin-like fold domain-containing protein [Streptomyces sp. CSDS2]MDN3259672.1 prealbumin-like fold domain-containing protein [Streptomyces sp. CSDS2]